jgi:hypothetical protein
MHVVKNCTKIPGHLRPAERQRLRSRLFELLELLRKRKSEELWKLAVVISSMPHGIDVSKTSIARPGELVFPVDFVSEGGGRFHWRTGYPEPFFIHQYENHHGTAIVRIKPNVKDGKPCCNA